MRPCHTQFNTSEQTSHCIRRSQAYTLDLRMVGTEMFVNAIKSGAN